MISKQELRKIEKLYNIKIYSRNLKCCRGYANTWNGFIVISYNLNKTRKDYLETIFHELGHLYCYKHKIYPDYHLSIRKTKPTLKEFRGKIKWALRAERYVDNWAEKELKQYDARFKYHKTYYESDAKSFLIDYFTKVYSKWIPLNKLILN